MARKIQVKRGNLANLPNLDVGEFGFAMDQNRTFIGGSAGNVELANKEEVTSQLAETKTDLEERAANVETFRTALDTNDATPINAAINFINVSGGGRVLLTKPLYEISSKITIKSNVKLTSVHGSVIKQKNDSNLINMADAGGLSVANVEFSNITFDLNVANQTQYTTGQGANKGRCIFIANSSKKIKFENITIKEMFGNAIYIVDSTDVTYENGELNDPSGSYIEGLYLVRVSKVKISKSKFIGRREFGVASSSYGVRAKDNVHQITVDDCYFEKFQCLLDGSENGATTPINRGTSLKITNCTFQSPAADTTIRYCKYGLMSNNIVRNSGDFGLSVGDSEHVIVSDNIVEDSNTVGIGIRVSNNCIVSNNILRDPCTNFRPDYPLVANQRVGIYVVGNSQRIIIEGNSVLDFRSSPEQMFHAIRVEDFAGGVKGNDTSWAIISNNVCRGSSSGIDIYADNPANVLQQNARGDGKMTGVFLGSEPYATPKLGDLRQNVLRQKPTFYDGASWRLLPKVVSVPATPTSPGKEGDIAYNSTHLYICISDNVWERIATDASWV